MWSQESSDYAIREAGGRVKIFKNFTEKATVKIEYAIEGMHGGALIGALGRLMLLFCIGAWAWRSNSSPALQCVGCALLIDLTPAPHHPPHPHPVRVQVCVAITLCASTLELNAIPCRVSPSHLISPHPHLWLQVCVALTLCAKINNKPLPLVGFARHIAPTPGCTPAGVRGADFVCFYDWNEGRLVRRIDVGAVKDIIWSDNGELVAIAGDASFYILQVCGV